MNNTFQTPDQLFPGLFEEVQSSSIFKDSKTFVDCLPKISTHEIMHAYNAKRANPDFDLESFVFDHFDLPQDHASGFKGDPSKTAAEHVNGLWPVLTRPGIKHVSENDSLIPIPFDYIVPGGRFGEIYYWDSYFTMLGLAVSKRFDLMENMVRNFDHMLHLLGHIPNGNRTYFISRSQPPFFAFMVKLLAEVKQDTNILAEYYPSVEKEYRFWMSGERYLPEYGLNRYWDDRHEPRQESYLEDIELSEKAGIPPRILYRHIRAACESGWDFTSRWLADGTNLHTIIASDIIPVDLNALLYGVEEILFGYYQSIHDERKIDAIEFNMLRRKVALNAYCWDDKTGIYRDWNIRLKEQTKIDSLATIYPVFVGLPDEDQVTRIAENLKEGFLKDGGLVTSLHNTGQQWDAPNGWAPLQWLAVKGLQNYGHDDLAMEIARRWTSLNEKVYKSTGKFVEKYNVEDITLEAGGGEYPVQDGFGWSNGVYLALKSLVG